MKHTFINSLTPAHNKAMYEEIQELRLAKTNLENQLSEARTIAKELEKERDASDEHHHRYVSTNLEDRQRVLGDCDSLRAENATLKRRLDEAMKENERLDYALLTALNTLQYIRDNNAGQDGDRAAAAILLINRPDLHARITEIDKL